MKVKCTEVIRDSTDSDESIEDSSPSWSESEDSSPSEHSQSSPKSGDGERALCLETRPLVLSRRERSLSRE